MNEMIQKYSTDTEGFVKSNLSCQINFLEKILQVLVKTVELNFETLTGIGTRRMDLFNSNLYSGDCSEENIQNYWWHGKRESYNFSDDLIQQLTECRKLFATLPVDVQNKIHRARALKLEPD